MCLVNKDFLPLQEETVDLYANENLVKMLFFFFSACFIYVIAVHAHVIQMYALNSCICFILVCGCFFSKSAQFSLVLFYKNIKANIFRFNSKSIIKCNSFCINLYCVLIVFLDNVGRVINRNLRGLWIILHVLR